jgi:hypothetical protein
MFSKFTVTVVRMCRVIVSGARLTPTGRTCSPGG